MKYWTSLPFSKPSSEFLDPGLNLSDLPDFYKREVQNNTIEKKKNKNPKKNHKLIYIVSEETKQAYFLSPR